MYLLYVYAGQVNGPDSAVILRLVLFSLRQVVSIEVKRVFYFAGKLGLVGVAHDVCFVPRVHVAHAVMGVLVGLPLPVYNGGLHLQVRQLIQRLGRIELFVVQSDEGALGVQGALAVGEVVVLANAKASHGVLGRLPVQSQGRVQLLGFHHVLYLVKEYLFVYRLFLFRLGSGMLDVEVALRVVEPLGFWLVLVQGLEQVVLLGELLFPLAPHFVPEQVEVVLDPVSLFYGNSRFLRYLTQLILEVNLLGLNGSADLVHLVVDGALQVVAYVSYEFGSGHARDRRPMPSVQYVELFEVVAIVVFLVGARLVLGVLGSGRLFQLDGPRRLRQGVMVRPALV